MACLALSAPLIKAVQAEVGPACVRLSFQSASFVLCLHPLSGDVRLPADTQPATHHWCRIPLRHTQVIGLATARSRLVLFWNNSVSLMVDANGYTLHQMLRDTSWALLHCAMQ